MLQALINGLLIGGVYSLVAAGLNLIFGVMNIVNFAQGEFLMLGMVASYALYRLFPTTSGMLSYLWVIPSMLLVGLFGLALYRFLIRPIVHKRPSVQILVTIGLSLGLQGADQIIMGSSFRAIPGIIHTASFRLGSVTLMLGPVVAGIVAVIATSILAWVLGHTWWGRAVRALAERPNIAALMGIEQGPIFTSAFVVGISLAAAAGALLMPYYYVYPTVGSDFVVVAFLVVVIAGLGNVGGSMLGGFLLGIVESFTATYLSVDFSIAAIYVMFLLVLILRPQGLFTLRRRQI